MGCVAPSCTGFIPIASPRRSPIHFLLFAKLCRLPLLLCRRSALPSTTATRSHHCSSLGHQPPSRSCASFFLERGHPQAAAPSITEAKATVLSHRCRASPTPAFHGRPPGKLSTPCCSHELRAPHRPANHASDPFPGPSPSIPVAKLRHHGSPLPGKPCSTLTLKIEAPAPQHALRPDSPPPHTADSPKTRPCHR
jgi:hypothetical protein